MGLFKWIDKWVYNNSVKPNHYKRVKNPPKTILEKIMRPQDARQQQFNNWCKRFGVFCGSYLPQEHRKLLKKGWFDSTHPNGKIHRPDIVEYTRKSTNQKVVHHDHKNGFDEHYHWYNNHSKNKDDYYFDRYGEVCKKDKPATHLAPFDKNYNMRKKKK